jgi:hypothetical protein
MLPMCECGKVRVSTPSRVTEETHIAKCGEIGVSIHPSKKSAIIRNLWFPYPFPSERVANLGGFHGRPGIEICPSASAGNLGSPCPVATGSAQKCKGGKLGVSMHNHRGNHQSVGNTRFACPIAREIVYVWWKALSFHV